MQTVMQEQQKLFYIAYIQQVEACHEGERGLWLRV
jgi:hypothetical protein